jgi:hypothetical protein
MGAIMYGTSENPDTGYDTEWYTEDGHPPLISD